MNDSPEISVLMSVYNSDQFILDSISSVLNQTFRNFEFIIIDDGSTDNSLNIIKSISDDRIRLFVNNQNRGLIFSLNKGVELAKGKYIVRMDSDDLCFPNRLELQYNFMQTHPEIGVCGSDYDNFSETFYKSCHTIKGSEVLKAWLLFSTPLCHPTVIIRKSILPKDPYDVNFLHVEDYELWTRLALTSSIENLPETLLKYRHHPAQVSIEKRSEQLIRVKEIQRNYLNNLGFKFSNEDLQLHSFICSGQKIYDIKYIVSAENWLLNLISQNKSDRLMDDFSLKYCTAKIYYDICGNTSLGLKAFLRWNKSPLRKFYGSDLKLRIRQLMKCIVRKFSN